MLTIQPKLLMVLVMLEAHRHCRHNPIRVSTRHEVGGQCGLFHRQRLSPHAAVVAVCLSVLLQEYREGVDIVVEAELAYCPDNILGHDGLVLLALAPDVGFACNEADELRHALLDGLFGVVGDFGGEGNSLSMMRITLAIGINRSCSRTVHWLPLPPPWPPQPLVVPLELLMQLCMKVLDYRGAPK